MFSTQIDSLDSLIGTKSSPEAPAQILRPCSAQCPTSCRDPLHDRTSLRSWLQLQATLGLCPEFAIQLLGGSPDPDLSLIRAKRPGALAARDLDQAVDELRGRGYGVLPWTFPTYPPRLAAISDPAPVLSVAGNPALLHGPCVAIVGARAATVYGLDVARALGFRLAKAGIAVVSGLARGIDAAAHRGALEAGGPTVAVQACGPDRVYPPEHRALAQSIQANGALVTELPVGAPPRRPYFPLRNRLISGLSIAVVVVEAREKSGSLITARHALDQGREVMAVPGAVTSATSWGPNRLIRDGAVPVLKSNDVLENLGISSLGLGRPTGGKRPKSQTPRSDSEAVSLGFRNEPESGASVRPAAASGVLATLECESLTRDELGRRLSIEPRQLDLQLADLELAGQISLDRDGRIATRAFATRGIATRDTATRSQVARKIAGRDPGGSRDSS